MVTLAPRSILAALPNWLEKLLLVLLCWQLAGMFWRGAEPDTQKVKLALPRQSSGQGVVSREPFLRWYASDEKGPTEALGDYRLVAVIAGREGAAVLKNPGGSVAARVGSQIVPGSKLVAVEPDRIVVEQGGARKTLKFPETVAAAEPLYANVKNTTAPPSRRALAPISVTRGQMAQTVQGGNLGSWDNGLASPPDGGIRIEDVAAQPWARLLRLANGDILKSVNQRPLVQLADISLISYYFGQQSSVDLTLIRNGAQITQHYDIQP